MKNFHCCATCRHFRAEKKAEGMVYFCNRLGFKTKTNYQFNCWSPKENIKKLMENEYCSDRVSTIEKDFE